MSFPVSNSNTNQLFYLTDPMLPCTVADNGNYINFIPAGLSMEADNLITRNIKVHSVMKPYYFYIEEQPMQTNYFYDDEKQTYFIDPWNLPNQLYLDGLESQIDEKPTKFYEVNASPIWTTSTLNPDAEAFIPKEKIKEKSELSIKKKSNHKKPKKIKLVFDAISLIPSKKEEAGFDDFTNILYMVGHRKSLQKLNKQRNNHHEKNYTLFFSNYYPHSRERLKILKEITEGLEQTKTYKNISEANIASLDSESKMKNALNYSVDPEMLIFNILDTFLPASKNHKINIKTNFFPDYKIIHGNPLVVETSLVRGYQRTKNPFLRNSDANKLMNTKSSRHNFLCLNMIYENFEDFTIQLADKKNIHSKNENLKSTILNKSKFICHLILHIILDHDALKDKELISDILFQLISCLTFTYEIKEITEDPLKEFVRCLTTFLSQKSVIDAISEELNSAFGTQSKAINNIKSEEDEEKVGIGILGFLPPLIIEMLNFFASKKEHSKYYFAIYACASNLSKHFPLLFKTKQNQLIIIKHTNAIISFIRDQLFFLETYSDIHSNYNLLTTVRDFWIPTLSEITEALSENFLSKDISELRKSIVNLNDRTNKSIRISETEKPLDISDTLVNKIFNPKKHNRLHLAFKEEVKTTTEEQEQKNATNNEKLNAKLEVINTYHIDSGSKSSLIQDVNNALVNLKADNEFGNIKRYVDKKLGRHIRHMSHQLWIYSEVAFKFIKECSDEIASTTSALNIAASIHNRLKDLSEKTGLTFETPDDSRSFLRRYFSKNEINLDYLENLKITINRVNGLKNRIQTIIYFFNLALDAGRKITFKDNKIEGEISLSELTDHLEHTKYILTGVLKRHKTLVDENVSMSDILMLRKKFLTHLKFYGENSFDVIKKHHNIIASNQKERIKMLKEDNVDNKIYDQTQFDSMLLKINDIYRKLKSFKRES